MTTDYSTKTRDELITICKEKGIKGCSGMKKDDIVKILLGIDTTNEISTESSVKNNEEPPVSTILNHISKEDIITYLDKLPPMCVDTIILDPPYYRVVNEEWDKQWDSLDEYTTWMETVVKKLSYVSKYSTSVWLFGMAYQLGYLIPIFERYGFTYRQHIVLDKGIRSVAGRTSAKLKMFPTATEYIVFFHKEARDVIKSYLQQKLKDSGKTPLEVNTALGKATNGGGKWSTLAGIRQKNIQYPTREDWNALTPLLNLEWKYDDYVFKFHLQSGLTDVWNDIVFQERGRIHPTQKPAKLIERLIKCSTDKGDIVLDPFMGSGQTARVAKQHERHYLGCEISDEYFKNLTDVA
jgi:DNA modification methylase